MPQLNLSANVRLLLYVLGAIGGAVVTYLVAKGVIGDAELTLWAAVSTLLSTLAAANVRNSPEPAAGRHVRTEGDTESREEWT